MIDLKAHLQAATRPERVVPVCLDGALIQALDEAKARLDATPETNDPRANGASPRARAEQAVEDARQAVQEAALPFRLRAVSRPTWTSLTANHGPREGNSDDRLMGFNAETFPIALVRACLVDPAVESDEDWDALDEALTFGQFDELVTVAHELSRRRDDIVPFSFAASAPTGGSAPKSRPRAS